MSKSLGNVVSPIDVAGRRGADILRLWVAMVDFLDDMRVSDEILDRNAEAYRKIRNTFRYLLGNLAGFDAERDRVAYEDMPEIDRWALQRLEQLRTRLVEAYSAHQYHVVYHGLQQFCAVTLSSFYLAVLKDRLYTYPPRSAARRSAQTVLHRLATDLCRLMAPVLCFTADEIWQELEALHGRDRWTGATVHAERFPEPLEVPPDAELLARWERFGELRDEISKVLEAARRDGRIGSSLEARVRLEAAPEDDALLRALGEPLRFLLIVSGVELERVGEGGVRSERVPGLAIEVDRALGTKCARCWNFTTDVDSDPELPGACARCAAHVREARRGGGAT